MICQVADQPVSAQAGPAGSGRGALVARAGAHDGRPALRARTSATFLAQLIATAQQAPQTREKRRLEPQAAIRAYAAATARLRAPQ
ncbi:MAG TPA: hypothetical protein VHA55_00985 [Pseudorhodoplanes sp.]|jgi:hypothetical protein|nr:hypothetical protein [Pseudorhodoplanes sp.]